jgi:glycosyltransferase involved in cell wall biosynthesis
MEDLPVPAEIEQVRWPGGRGAFRWRDVPRLVGDLKRVIRAVKPELIHAGPIQTCAFLSVLTGFHPVLSMSWGFDLMQDAERSAWWRWVTRYTLRHSTFFTSDARVTRDRAVAYGMQADRTRVFPWGVDLDRFRPQYPRRKPTRVSGRKRAASVRAVARPHSSPEPFVLLCNRSWEPRYGVNVLAGAFVEAARRDRSLSLVLLGSGSLAQSIRAILAEGGEIDRVQFGGYVAQADLPRWYHLADLFVSPSHVDGSSVSLMEALACGLPVLVSDIPANREWVRDGVNGWLYPDGEVGELAERILDVARHRTHLGHIRRAARDTAKRRADWNKNFAILLGTYRKVLRLESEERVTASVTAHGVQNP